MSLVLLPTSVYVLSLLPVHIYCTTMVVSHNMWGNDLLGEGLISPSAFLFINISSLN